MFLQEKKKYPSCSASGGPNSDRQLMLRGFPGIGELPSPGLAQICLSPVLISPLSLTLGPLDLEPFLNHFHPNPWLRSASEKTQPKSQAPQNTLHQSTFVHHHTQAQGIPRSTRQSAGYTKSLQSRRGGTGPPGTKVRKPAVSLKCPGDKLNESLFHTGWSGKGTSEGGGGI